MTDITPCTLCGRQHPRTEGCGPGLTTGYVTWPTEIVAGAGFSDQTPPAEHPTTLNQQPHTVKHPAPIEPGTVVDEMGLDDYWALEAVRCIHDDALAADDLTTALKAVELVMRHRGMLNDHTTHSGSVRVEIVGITPENLR